MQESLERELKTRERRMPTGEAYYWYSDIPSFVGRGTPSMSSFRRRVNEGKIHTVTVKDQEEAAFLASDVLKFLHGEFNKPRGGARRGKVEGMSAVAKVSSSTVKMPLIDVAHLSDLPYISLMEYEQVDLGGASIHTLASWLKKNSEVYWLLSNPANRQDVWATFGVLPLADDMIFRVLRGEVALNDITSDSIQVYDKPGESYSYYLSAIARPERQDLLPLLVRRVFTHWCEQPRGFDIKSLYIATHGEEGSPAWQIVREFYFAPRYDLDQADRGDYAWELRLDHPNPSIDVQNLKKCFEKQKESSSVVIAPTRTKVEELRELEAEATRKKHDLRKLMQRQLQISPDGYLIDHLGNVLQHLRYRPIESDDDIRATLRINASHFGPSKRYTEDQLVAQRRAFLARNPDTYRVLEFEGEVIAFINALPLPMDIIARNLIGEMKLSDVKPEELLEYKPDSEPVDIYLQTMGIHNDIQGTLQGKIGSYMIRATWSMIKELGKRGVRVNSIYTLSEKKQGMGLLQSAGFKRCDDFTNPDDLVYRLDFSDRDNPFLEEYHQNLDEYFRSCAVGK